MKRYRIGRKVLQGLGALGAGFLTYKAVTSEDGMDIYNVGFARFGRAAIAVIHFIRIFTSYGAYIGFPLNTPCPSLLRFSHK
jgi:hypothetical protein